MWKKILAITAIGAYPSSSFLIIRDNLQQTLRKGSHLFESTNQAKESLRSLVDYNEDTWKGIATSFSVSNDVAAGIRTRKISSEYKSTVKIGLDLVSQDLKLSEIFEWDDKMKKRELSLGNAGTDVDSVDGSYSFDTTFPDLPTDLIGTEKLVQFGIEHCVAVSDDARIRVFALYGIDKFLARIIVCEEERDTDQSNGKVLQGSPRQGDTSSIEAEKSNERLIPVSISLSEMTSGVWLGDMILREPNAPEEPKGFGSNSRPVPSKNNFGDWSVVGVQKLSHQWRLDREDSIQKIVTVGKPLGIGLPEEMATSISGVLCKDESSDNNLPKEMRMIYLDWMGGNQVGIFLKNIAMQLPRYLDFEKTGGKTRRNFFTEVSIYQAKSDRILDVTDATVPPDLSLVCSVIARAYSSDGQLKQASTGFFSLDRR